MFDAAPSIRIDAATATSKGGREYQEDAVLSDFAVGTNVGFSVLADGMGGHAAGDIASKIVVTVMFSELSFRRAHLEDHRRETPDLLVNAAETANQCIADYVGAHPQAAGMGATLVAVVVERNLLRWISVGDSPLYLFRDGALRQLNADHSLANQIDLLMRRGVLSPEEAENHPDRNVLTSVLMGEDIPQIDVSHDPFELLDEDVVVVASDGIQALTDEEIAEVLQEYRHATSQDIARELMDAVDGQNRPNLDNVSFAVMRVESQNIIPEAQEAKIVEYDHPRHPNVP